MGELHLLVFAMSAVLQLEVSVTTYNKATNLQTCKCIEDQATIIEHAEHCIMPHTLFIRHDTTKMGHDLGAPQNCIYVTPERDLSARAVCILRALMHSAFIWASCNNDQALGAIAGLVNAQVPPQQLPEFFWAHLEKDLELLGKDTKKGLEENVMILHLVLRQILTLNPPTGRSICVINFVCFTGSIFQTI